MFTRGKHSKRYKQWLGLVKYRVHNSSYVHFVHESKVFIITINLCSGENEDSNNTNTNTNNNNDNTNKCSNESIR